MAFRSPTTHKGQRVSGIGMRVTIATSTAALVLGAAGCSTGGSAKTDDQSPDNTLSKIDPCSILNPSKAEQLGLPSHGTPTSTIESEPGCTYIGSNAGIGIYRIAGDSLDEYGNRAVWSKFDRLQVNGREGAQARGNTWAETDCLTAVAAGGGIVSVQANASDPRKPFDGCAESLKVAKLIEPDLPK